MGDEAEARSIDPSPSAAKPWGTARPVATTQWAGVGEVKGGNHSISSPSAAPAWLLVADTDPTSVVNSRPDLENAQP